MKTIEGLKKKAVKLSNASPGRMTDKQIEKHNEELLAFRKELEEVVREVKKIDDVVSYERIETWNDRLYQKEWGWYGEVV